MNHTLNEAIELAKKERDKILINAQYALIEAFSPRSKLELLRQDMRIEIFILAGSVNQALHYFAREINTNEYQILNKPEKLRNLGSNTKIKIIKIGTWYKRPPNELQEIHNMLLMYDHEGILMDKSWTPDSDTLCKLDKLIKKAGQLDIDEYSTIAQDMRKIYIKYGYIEKRRANHLYKTLMETHLILLQLFTIFDEIIVDETKNRPSEGMDMNTVFKDGIDSLNAIEFLIAVEEKFDIDISDEDIQKLETFGQVTRYIHKNRNSISIS